MEKIISNFICRNTRVQILTLTSLLFFTFLLGCNHANSDLQSKGVLIDNVANYARKEMIAQVLEYNGYNENLSCAIRVDDDRS